MQDWKYYNHALISNIAPFKIIDESAFRKKKFWNAGYGGVVLFARYTSDYDCGYETKWWYCVKDDIYEIESLKSKRRYVINKGRKNFQIKKIRIEENLDQLVNIEIEAWKTYPSEYRPAKDIEKLRLQFKNVAKSGMLVLGAFDCTNKLCGYLIVDEHPEYCNYVQHKVYPYCEKNEINAALVDGMLTYYNDRLKKGYKIYDGERNLIHQTSFQEYLVKYFGFRFAYCNLKIKYRFPVNIIVRILFPFRERIYDSKNKFLYKVGGVLKMEEIKRECQRISVQ